MYKIYPVLLNGGESSQSNNYNPQATPQQFASMYNQYLPQTLQTVSGQAAPVASSLANAAAGANPTYTASGLGQLAQYAPAYQAIGGDLTQQQASTTAQLLGGMGGVSAAEATGLSNALNPTQVAAQNQATNLVNSINLNGLSGGEQAAVERSLNQSNYATGNLGLDNATNAVSNAMNFGNALQAKRTALGSALGTASGVAANQNTFANPVGTALNAGNTSGNFGLGTFNPTQANSTLTTPFNTATGFGTQLAGVSAASTGSGSSGTAQGSLCCFIFLEALNGHLPWWVRICRDEYYQKEPTVAIGYKRMAKCLVPAMKYIPGIKWIVNKLMVRPIIAYGGYIKQVKGYEEGWKYHTYKLVWFKIWKFIGEL